MSRGRFEKEIRTSWGRITLISCSGGAGKLGISGCDFPLVEPYDDDAVSASSKDHFHMSTSLSCIACPVQMMLSVGHIVFGNSARWLHRKVIRTTH